MPFTLIPSEICYGALTQLEGVMLKEYNDRGVPAIASGHSNRSGLPPIVGKAMRITSKQAEAITRQDLAVYAVDLYRKLNSPKAFGWMTQGIWDALVHISINAGAAGTLDRDPLNLRPLILKGDWTGMVKRIRKAVPPYSVEPGSIWLGISRRREAEALMAEGASLDKILKSRYLTAKFFLDRKL